MVGPRRPAESAAEAASGEPASSAMAKIASGKRRPPAGSAKTTNAPTVARLAASTSGIVRRAKKPVKRLAADARFGLDEDDAGAADNEGDES